ncbi:A-kinase anchor protein 8-like isoform X2 [Engystomops pustulosus]|uniref:A-kinase anchor protein 8-like isoform X2 n=1 Tax=Engystomops pustulosus TaxID=76066 RepID=UPI003AFB0217
MRSRPQMPGDSDEGAQLRGAARRRLNGYESYDYSYDYVEDSYRPSSEAWMTSYNGATHMETTRESYYNRTEGSSYGYSEPERGYGGRREQYPSYPALGRAPTANFWDNSGRGARTPSLLVQHGAFSEMGAFQDLRAFTGNSYFGGGFKQKNKKSWKKKMPQDREQPAVKKIRTAEDEAQCGETGSEGDGNAAEPARSSRTDEDREEERPEESEQKPSSSKSQETQNRRIGDRLVERIQFVCSICKFRTFYDEEMKSHLQSNFHKEHFSHVGGRLPKQAAEFLQEYVLHKTKKTEERRGLIEDLSTTIQQIYRNQDLTQGLGMEHFVKKVEAAHCAACNVFIPMHHGALHRHIKSPLHNQNRRVTMENSKKTAMAVARSILNNKQISQKLEQYMQGQNPFIDNREETASACSRDSAAESQESESLPCSTYSESNEMKTYEDPAPEQSDMKEEGDIAGQDAGVSPHECESLENTEIETTDKQ